MTDRMVRALRLCSGLAAGLMMQVLSGCMTMETVSMHDREAKVQTVSSAATGDAGLVVEYRVGLYGTAGDRESFGTETRFGMVSAEALAGLAKQDAVFAGNDLPVELSRRFDRYLVAFYPARLEPVSSTEAETLRRGATVVPVVSLTDPLEERVPVLYHSRGKINEGITNSYLVIKGTGDRPRLFRVHFPSGVSSSSGMKIKKALLLPLAVVADIASSPVQLAFYLYIKLYDPHFGF